MVFDLCRTLTEIPGLSVYICIVMQQPPLTDGRKGFWNR